MLLRPTPPSSPSTLRSLLSPSRRSPSLLLLLSTPKRRRRRKSHRLLIHSSLDDLVTSPSSLHLLGPAIGFLSGTALFLSSKSTSANLKADSSTAPSPIGEWVLFTSPTPFNRSVLLRCPSVSFGDGGELLDGVNDRLVTETRHYVNFSTGGEIPVQAKEEAELDLSYQRVCVRTKDGGVLSLDWPENLDLRKEHGLDTTVVVVPGTPQGSMERRVKLFVLDALRHGYFPVVMNPRGCAGSPVTTPRLFTAADSDDISTVVRFLNTVRPWTTLVGVSWGYGSNMLTKYVAEVGDSTPLTAAVCIDNPFDLDDATRSIPHRLSFDQELLSGLIDILQANKELFLGKGKGFDVEKALSAVTLRDFDEAISMVSHGCDSVEEFYASTSTSQSIQNVKTPVLFIQSDNGTVPVFSIPRTEISENPFTSLLLCSCLSSGTIRSDQSAVTWCQQLAIEWLSAVELAFLKGRHPLLEDIDISINPSFVNGTKNKQGRRYRESSPLHLNKTPLNGYLIGPPPVEVDSKNGGKGGGKSREGGEIEGSKEDVKEEEEVEEEEGEESQVLQTATVVMNMLDVTMPGTLNDEQKKKVLTAMERGETLMKALQGAVPEDVRGKLTTVATEILQSQKSNLSLNVLKKVGWTNPSLDPKPKTQDNNNTSVKEKDSSTSPPEQSSAPAPSDNPSSTGTLHPEKGLQNSGDGETVQDQHENSATQVSDEPSVVPNEANPPKDEVKRVEAPTIEQSSPAHENGAAKTEEPSRVASSQPPPSINVTQALDALTGFDDSTQIAVNSVFGVLENMIEQLEKKQEHENDDDDATETKESKDAVDQNTEVRNDEPNNVEMKLRKVQDKKINQPKEIDHSHNYLTQDFLERVGSAQNLYWSMQYTQYFHRYAQKQLDAEEELDSKSATDLVLDPQEGKWKMENPAQNSDNYSETPSISDGIVEPSYVILETSNEEEGDIFTATREQVALFIRDKLLDALETEVHRKLGVLKLDFEKVDETLVCDIEELATSVSEKVVMNSELNLELFSRHDIPKEKIGTIEGELLIKTVSCAVNEANHLRRLLPMGLIVGAMLACLRKYFQLGESHGDDGEIKIKEGYVPKCYDDSLDGEKEEQDGKEKELEMDRREGQGIMVGTFTAALGASALLVQHQKNEEREERFPSTSNQKGFLSGLQTKLEEDEAQEKNGSLVSSLAEKAMSVAGPVVPTKSDGEVDHERLVAVLAELGQKGGILRMVGKLALLWGGIRGAMSLTDRLISFLHLGERPLLHRLLGFVGMALLLWTPVVIPMLPTLVQCWSMRASTGIVGYACVLGLYASVTILVMLWGKRIRGYDDPVAQYGLDLTSATRVYEFVKGVAGGVMVVLSVHSVNTLLGNARFSWPLSLPPLSSGSLTLLKSYGNVLILVARGLVTAAGVSLVEELFFRSWLQEEIAVDYGYYQAILFSGILFSLIHRSVHSIPGYLLLSVVLSGIKQRFMGKLAAPIGLRAGIMSASHILNTGGFIIYAPNTPFWLKSSYPLHPFDGAVGFGICLLLAITFFPHKNTQEEER